MNTARSPQGNGLLPLRCARGRWSRGTEGRNHFPEDARSACGRAWEISVCPVSFPHAQQGSRSPCGAGVEISLAHAPVSASTAPRCSTASSSTWQCKVTNKCQASTLSSLSAGGLQPQDLRSNTIGVINPPEPYSAPHGSCKPCCPCFVAVPLSMPGRKSKDQAGLLVVSQGAESVSQVPAASGAKPERPWRRRKWT